MGSMDGLLLELTLKCSHPFFLFSTFPASRPREPRGLKLADSQSRTVCMYGSYSPANVENLDFLIPCIFQLLFNRLCEVGFAHAE